MSGEAVIGDLGFGYISSVQAKIKRTGDRFGLVLPKELQDACGFGGEATVTVRDKTLVVSPSPRRVCEGWAEALAPVSPAELKRDFAELQAFRDTPGEWGATEWQRA